MGKVRQVQGSGPAEAERAPKRLARVVAPMLIAIAPALSCAAQNPSSSHAAQPPRLQLHRPARVLEAQRFLAQRGWKPGQPMPRPHGGVAHSGPKPQGQGPASNPIWTPLGPAAVLTPQFGPVTARVSSLALDPSDSTGNHLYVGTTGGGAWMAENAAVSPPSLIVFTPLTDALSALGGVLDASISIGALTVQPGGTGVILAGTGDPNDALDSYYGAGILRSTDSGTTWSLISGTVDEESGLSTQDFGFEGEGFAGFAWSGANPQVVVAAVSQAYEGTLVDAESAGSSMEGLYYSADSGASWHLATVRDSAGQDVQGPLDAFPRPDGNAATAVVWNPVRGMFIAAVRYHGYYQSTDGAVWTRIASQPGASLTSLTAQNCPTDPGETGSIGCPIFRGALAVNPQTGDTFAWSVDQYDQDQGLWQDECVLTAGACANQNLTFAKQWNTAALETSTTDGPATIADGVYNLALAAVPSLQETIVFAGANDLWQTACPVSQGCAWRNTTNSTTCMSAQVGEFQHALAWNPQNPLEIFIGNDSGLWRSMDAVGETGAVCNASDASHFQNLNGQLQNLDGSPGSISEATSLSPVLSSPYKIMAGLGVNGFAGVKSGAAVADWPQILGGYGGPVAVPPANEDNWYVNDQAGVAIYLCAQGSACTPASFGTTPAVTDADVGNDGLAMLVPAPFVIDALDPTQLLIATCRLWRGPASGSAWSESNIVSPIFEMQSAPGPCAGDALVRSIAASAVSASSEVVYVGLYGGDYGAGLPGHVFAATIDSSGGAMPAWQDISLNRVANDNRALNAYGLDISSIVIDSHDPTGNTVYVTVEGAEEMTEAVQPVYRSTNGGATWYAITANLPDAPVSALAVDPENANIVYVATDQGVYFTTEVAACVNAPSNCWTPFGVGLPAAPVVALSASASASAPALVAATYGRGVWQTPLWSAETSLSAASANPNWIAFQGQVYGTTSAAQTVTVLNTGTAPLVIGAIVFSGDSNDFNAAGCASQTVPVGGSCAMQVTFTPQATGPRTAVMTVYANVYGGQLTVDLNGAGLPGGSVIASPASLSFGAVEVGQTSTPPQPQVTLTNLGSSSVSIASVTVTAPFVLTGNSCGASLAAKSGGNACTVNVEFAPTQEGAVSPPGMLTFTDSAGTQTVLLSGTGAAPPTDTLSASSLTFPATPVGQDSQPQVVTIANSGGVPLAVQSIVISPSTNFEPPSQGCLGGVPAAVAGQPPPTCSISVQFAPTQVGTNLQSTLTIVDALGTKSVALSGTGVQPGALSVSPASLSFSLQQPGAASAPQTVTVTNSGATALANIGFQITGPAAASYQWSASTCGALLDGGGHCTVQIVFTPCATGPIAATLAVSSSTPGVAAAQVQLNGSGQLSTGLSANPAQLPFTAVVGIGQSSAAQTVTITNSSGYAVSSLGLAATAPFTVAQNTCTGNLAAGANCTAGVVFQPSATGAASGMLTVTSAVVTAPATVALSGTGFDFSVAPSGSASATVTSGRQADYSIAVTPSGAEGTFTFQCGTLPANALCLFSPGSETLASGVEGNVEVEIYTGNSGLTAQAGRGHAFGRWPLLCGLLLLPFALRKRRKLFLLAILALVVGAGISSCAGAIGGTGGSTGQGNVNSTPPGTYSIPVTVTSTGISHATTLTLIVD